MEEDDFGDLYGFVGNQAPKGSAIVGSSSAPQKTYTFYDDEEGGEEEEVKEKVGKMNEAKDKPPKKLLEAMSSAERDSDEDDDLLLLGYSSKSSSVLASKVHNTNSILQGVETQGDLGFPELLPVSTSEIRVPLPNGPISTTTSVYTPNETSIKLPGISDFGIHTISIPGLSTTVNASPFDRIQASEDLAEDLGVDLSEDFTGDLSGHQPGDVGGHFPQDSWLPSGKTPPLEATEKGGSAQGVEDWDTDDSEDDLQIVLNSEYPYYQPTGEKPRVGKLEGGSEDEDEDEDLIIVDEAEGQLLQPPDALAMPADGSIQPALGEKLVGIGDEKEQDSVVPGVGALIQPLPRGGYGYTAYNSPYKYVRPGAAPLYGAGAPGGPALGRGLGMKSVGGRGEWRGSGRGLFGPPATSQMSSWPAPSGFEYTLPPSMTVFDIDLEAFEEKPWRQPTADVTDYFNFGFDETSWKDYCKQLAQLRLESTMQSKIRVYESGRSEQEYDPDLPPELAVAAGLHEAGDRIQHRSLESEATASTMGRRGHTPIIPLGRPIEVEGGLGDRRPSSDLRKQRIRDSDSIILVDAAEEEGLEEKTPDEKGKGQIADAVAKEDQIQEEEDEEEEEEEEDIDTKNIFKGKLQHPTWHKEDSTKEANTMMEISQVSEGRVRAGFKKTDGNMQVGPLIGKPISGESGKVSEESISTSQRETSRLRGTSKLTVAGRIGMHQDAENNDKDINYRGFNVKIYSSKEEQIETQEGSLVGAERSIGKPQTDLLTGQRTIDRTTIAGEIKEIQGDSPAYSSKRQRLASPEGSNTASWDDYDIQKSSRAVSQKEQRDSGESARSGRDDVSQSRKKHPSYSDTSRGDQRRESVEAFDSYRKKETISFYRHDIETEIHFEADNVHEMRKRQKPSTIGNETSKEGPRHWKEREEDVYGKSKGIEEASGRRGYPDKEPPSYYKEKPGSRPESRRKEEEERDVAYHKARGAQSKSRRKDEEDKEAAYHKERGSRLETKKREEEDKRERQDSRKKDVEDRKDRLDKGYPHRGREMETSNRRSVERKKKEDEYRRKDWSEEAGGHDRKEKEKHVSERYDRDTDQHLRRKEESSLKRERLQDSHKSKTHDEPAKERDSRQPNGGYHEQHGKSSKDEERPTEVSKSSKRHEEDKSWRIKDESNIIDSRRSAEPRGHLKDKRKDSDEHGKERFRGHEVRARSVSDKEGLHLSDSRDRDSGQHGRVFDDQKTTERRLHSDKHRSDSKRSRDSDKEGNDSASQLGDYSNTNRKRKTGSDKNDTTTKKRDSVTFATRDSQANNDMKMQVEIREEYHDMSSAKFANVKAFEEGSSDEDEQQKGRSKLERWASHKDLEFYKSEKPPTHEKIKREEKHRQGSTSRGKQRYHHPSESQDVTDADDGRKLVSRNKKGNVSIEHINGKVVDEESPSHLAKGNVATEIEEKKHGEGSGHDQGEKKDPSFPEPNMAAKLEKRKERFKVSVEENEMLRKLDREERQQAINDGSRQERPPRKRRWASG